MEENILILFLYFITLIVSLFIQISNFLSNKKISFTLLSNIFYIIMFFLVPIVFLVTYTSGTMVAKWRLFYIDDSYAKYISYFISLVGYIFFNIGYSIFGKIRINNKKFEIKHDKDENYKNEVVFFVLLIIGWISLIMWTKVYGSIFGILKYASRIRSGIIEIYNPYTIFKWFCPLLLLCSLYYFNNILEKITIKKLVLLVISMFGTGLYLLANDGRNLIISFLLAIIILLFNKRKVNFKALTKLAISIAFSIFLLSNLDNITKSIRNNEKITLNNDVNVVNLLNEEYGYIYTNITRVSIRENSNNNNYNSINEIKCIALALIPERMKPFNAITLHDYNDSNYGQHTGKIPSDIITSSIYMFGYLGVIILPLLSGFLLRWIESFFERRENNTFFKIISSLIVTMLTLRLIGYHDLSSIIFYFFFVYVAIIVKIFIYKINFKIICFKG